MSTETPINERIQELVNTNSVLLFMKGNRQAPQCGFSARVIEVLDSILPEYETVDVLSDPDIRDGIKTFSSWPTIPQLYVNGEFLGGCDIITEMAASGELFPALGVEPPPEIQPTIHLSDDAQEALLQAVQNSGGEGQLLRIGIDPAWQPSLSMSEPGPMDVVCQAGQVQILVDRLCAARVDGISIDLVDGPEGRGFKVENPNAPRLRELSVGDLKAMMDAGEDFKLVDVRTPSEFETAVSNSLGVLTSTSLKSSPASIIALRSPTESSRRRGALGFSTLKPRPSGPSTRSMLIPSTRAAQSRSTRIWTWPA